jgi:hypothetical protein
MLGNSYDHNYVRGCALGYRKSWGAVIVQMQSTITIFMIGNDMSAAFDNNMKQVYLFPCTSNCQRKIHPGSRNIVYLLRPQDSYRLFCAHVKV